MTTTKPSEVKMRSLVAPFPSLLKKVELEWALACLVLTAARLGDDWDRYVTIGEVAETLEAHPEGPSLLRNPFFRPSFVGLRDLRLLDVGDDGTMRLTPKALDLIAARQSAESLDVDAEGVK